MKIPNRLNIDGEEWKVNLVETKHDLGTVNFGTMNLSTLEINLDKDNRTDQTLLHELFHVIDKNNGLDLNEQQILSLSQGIYATIVNNDLDFRRGK